MRTKSKAKPKPVFVRLERAPESPADRAVTIADSAPAWVREGVEAAHDGTLPNDWIYQECEAAFDAIQDGSLNRSDDGSVHEWADSRVDVYTQARFQWAAAFCLQSLYASAEDAARDMGGDKSDVGEYIGVVQYCALCRIAEAMLEAKRSA